MPNKDTQYDLVSEDNYSGRCNFTKDDFQIGIRYAAKIVGKMDVPQPNHRNEIVAAMRRIRYDFKSQRQKKQRVFICISVDGISITYRRRKMKIKWWKEIHTVIYHHPIHRVFYVSHDSQDLKIFSYIARDNITNTFMCIVFKSYTDKDAVEIVGAIGQAFDICHKIHNNNSSSEKENDEDDDNDNDSDDSETGATDTDTNSSPDHKYAPGNCHTSSNIDISKNMVSSNQDLKLPNKSSSSTISTSNGLISNRNKRIKTNPKSPQTETIESFRNTGLAQLIFLLQDQITQIQNVKLELSILNSGTKNDSITSSLLEKLHEQHTRHNENLLGQISQISDRLNKIENSLASSPVLKSQSMNFPSTTSPSVYNSQLIARSSTYCYDNQINNHNNKLTQMSNMFSIDSTETCTSNDSLNDKDTHQSLFNRLGAAPSVPPRLHMVSNSKLNRQEYNSSSLNKQIINE